jgi:O-antigen/teichoic acid export membrane protein
MQTTSRGGLFTGRVIAVFGTQVVNSGVAVINGILLARLLGPAGKGDYYLLVLVPSTAMVVLQLGLPQAFGFFAARGRMAGLVAKSLLLTVAFTALTLASLVVLLPVLQALFLGYLDPQLILLGFVAFPLALNSALTTGIVTGRQAVRWYSGVSLVDQLTTTVALGAVMLAGITLSVEAALVIYLLSWVVHTVGFAVGAKVVSRQATDPRPPSYRELFGYGLPFFPGSLAGFFSYRVDTYLLAFLIANPSEQLGYYSIAVSLAEMVFYFPRAVATLFFPQVAGSSRTDADRLTPLISRVTLLVTGMFAVLLIPAAWVMIELFVPAFTPSFPALVVLLPGVVALSATNVLSGYLAGIGKPGHTSSASVAALIANVIANLILIPRFGIIGASASSLISYSFSSLVMTVFASRLSGVPLFHFWIPRPSDVAYVAETVVALIRRLLTGRRASGTPTG